jgi:hypothetical protein
MTTKAYLIPLFFSVLVLAGCGNDGQQAPAGASNIGSAASAANTSVAREAATDIAEDQIHSLAPNVLDSAKLTGAACSLDTIDDIYFNDQLKLVGGERHVFRGWVLDNTKHPAGSFSLVLKGSRIFAIPAATGVTRKDVSDFYKDPSLISAGFSISAELSPVPAGEYSLLFMIQSGQSTYYCDAKKSLTLQ